MGILVSNISGKQYDGEWRDRMNGKWITVRIDRKTIFGNPYMIGRDGDREHVVKRYQQYMHAKYAEGGEYMRKMNSLAVLAWYRNVRLGCWCVPKDCHGYAILDFVNHLNSVREV